jgi:hypothetical protein
MTCRTKLQERSLKNHILLLDRKVHIFLTNIPDCGQRTLFRIANANGKAHNAKDEQLK